MRWLSLNRLLTRRSLGLLSAPLLLALLLAWQRPWTDSALTATVSLTTDARGQVAVRHVRDLFSERADRANVTTLEFPLAPLKDQLVRLDITGDVTHRSLPDSSVGYLACTAELVRKDGVEPLEFIGWQQGPQAGLHIGPVGPQPLSAPGKDPGGYVFSMKNDLWRVFRAPSDARLRVRLKPLPASSLAGQPTPFVPSQLPEDLPTPWPTTRPDTPPNVFIYLIDTLRPDHLGCYGYDRPTSPVIDAFARDATLYERAFTPSTWTRPSVASLLTGLPASVHRAMHESDVLDQWPRLMSEILQDAGYSTACVTVNFQVAEQAGFDQGYDRFMLTEPMTATRVNTVAMGFLESSDPRKPVFMYLHSMEPHEPYTPRPDTLKLFDRGFTGRFSGPVAHMMEVPPVHPGLTADDYEHIKDLYDAKILEADEGFALFLDTLRRTDRYENSLIILVSDHGESFGEHDTWGHGWTLNRQDMHVVLLVRYPGGALSGTRVAHPVSLLDVLPTTLARAGLKPDLPYPLAGHDLFRAAQQSSDARGRRFYGETAFWDANNLDLVGIIDEDGYKRVIDVSVLPRETASKQSLGLWDTSSDPDEQKDLSQTMPVRAAYDEQLIASWLLTQRQWRTKLNATPPAQVHWSPEMRQKLMVLGYLGQPAPKGNQPGR